MKYNYDPSIHRPLERSGIVFPINACWLLDTHSEQAEDIYARTEVDVGPARYGRKYTEVPAVRSAKIFLNFEQSKKFHEWYEDTLGAGTLRFSAQFHEVGVGIRWFEAEFVKPWSAEFVASGNINEEGVAERMWKISVELRLYGDGSMRDPRETPELSARFVLPLVTKCSMKDANFLTASFSCPLTSYVNTDTMSAAFSTSLSSLVISQSALSAGFYTYLSSKVSS